MSKKLRNTLRAFLVNTPLWRPIRFIKGYGDLVLFYLSPHYPSPRLYKVKVIRDLLIQRDFRTFVETGTNDGDTIEGVIGKSPPWTSVYSVEADEEKYHAALKKFAGDPRVHIYFGDSAEVLPTLPVWGQKDANLPAPKTLFFLDAHPGDPDEPSPIRGELAWCLAHASKESIILIDDARWFDGSHAPYPSLGEIKSQTDRHVEVKNDIIYII